MRNETQTQNKSQYELSRDERIKANLERMQKLGIADISLELKSQFQAKRATKSFSNRTMPSSGPSPIRKPGPVRRSSRLQNSTPVSYSETPLGKKDKGVEEYIMLEEGGKPEIYTEEHEKLLGHTERSWTLFEDGYGKDGKRIYDSVRGKTCHQCRQKTLGCRTHCSLCNKTHGQFCGDCLYMRYGEHVLEAIENPKWICPVCRGICNCSFCRTAKGWPPTGLLYRKIVQLGFKSVAHYLIQTQRAETNSVQNLETPEQVSARRSLPFLDTDKENLEVDHNDLGQLTPIGEQKGDDEFRSEKENEKQNCADVDMKNQTSARRSLSFPDNDYKVGDHLGLPKLQSESSTNDLKDEEEIKEDCVALKLGDGTNGLETTSKSKKKLAKDIEPNVNSIAGRLRLRRQKVSLPEQKENIPDGDPDAITIMSEDGVKKDKEVLFTDFKGEDEMKIDSVNMKLITIMSEDGVKKEKEVLFTDFKGEDEMKIDSVNMKLGDSNNALAITSKSEVKLAQDIEPSADSIAGRLRQQKGDDHDDLPEATEKIPAGKLDANKILSEKEVEKERCVMFTGNEHGGDSSTALKGSSKVKKKRVLAAEPSADSVAGRLRQRRNGI